MIILQGSRGVGKTTLIQQYFKDHCPLDKSVWLSLDHILFSTQRIVEVIDELYESGYRYFALDEVQKYADWSIVVKNIYDSYPDIQVILTASSALDIMSGMADLSRRADVYTLRVLSFREYLGFEYGIHYEKISFDDIIERPVEIAESIVADHNILKLFEGYNKIGYYPFFKDSKRRYPDRFKNIVNQVIEVDLPPIFLIDYKSIRQIKRLLALIARLVPYSPDITQLSKDVGIGRNRILLFLDYLQSAGLIQLLKSTKKSDSVMAKPDKIFLDNTNLIHALGLGVANPGTMRETFAMNALSATQEVSTPVKGDFMIDHTYIAEVGGKSKSYHQITGVPNAFLVKDEIDVGSEGVVPLWLLGMMY